MLNESDATMARKAGVRWRHQSGATLMELLLVVAIFAIMAAIAVPSYQATIAKAQARSAVAEIASEIRMARHLAMTRRERLVVRFDLGEKVIRICRADLEEILDVYRYAEKNVIVDEPTAGLELFFHPSGRAATATTIMLHGTQGAVFKLTVSLTGRVVMS